MYECNVLCIGKVIIFPISASSPYDPDPPPGLILSILNRKHFQAYHHHVPVSPGVHLVLSWRNLLDNHHLTPQSSVLFTAPPVKGDPTYRHVGYNKISKTFMNSVQI